MPTPTANSVAGKGTDLMVMINSSYTSIAGVRSISGPSIKIGNRDVTSLLSAWMENAPTIPDGGDLTMDIMYDSTSDTQKRIQTLIATPTSSGEQWKIILSNSKFFTFYGNITGFAFSGMDVQGTVTAQLGVKVSGAITFPTS